MFDRKTQSVWTVLEPAFAIPKKKQTRTFDGTFFDGTEFSAEIDCEKDQPSRAALSSFTLYAVVCDETVLISSEDLSPKAKARFEKMIMERWGDYCSNWPDPEDAA